jgi:hypothetical protein
LFNELRLDVGAYDIGAVLLSQDECGPANPAPDVENAPISNLQPLDEVGDIAFATGRHESDAPDQLQHGGHRVVIFDFGRHCGIRG